MLSQQNDKSEEEKHFLDEKLLISEQQFTEKLMMERDMELRNIEGDILQIKEIMIETADSIYQ